MKPHFDIVVILPLQEEMEQFKKVFGFVKDHTEGTELRLQMSISDSPLTVLCTLQDDMGKSAASSACSRILRWCDTGLVVCLGIAGGISSDLKLGDIAYTGSVLDVYDNSKAIDKDVENYELLLSPKPFETSREISVLCNFIKVVPALKPALDMFETTTKTFREGIGIKKYTGRNEKKEQLGPAKFLPGCLICGVVSKSVVYNKQLQGLNRRILAIETESGGVFEAAAIDKVDVICIRGISDYADGDKKKLEEETGGKLRSVAAFNASSFLALQMRSTAFQAELVKRRKNTPDLFHDTISPAFLLSETISRISKYLEEYLRGVSPLYKMQPTGFRLPIPRVRLNRGSVATQEKPLEIPALLRRRDRLVLVLPKMYPDNGLPCVLAQELMKTTIGDKQPVPIFIDAKGFSPPQDLLKLASEPFETVATLDGALPIVIISNPPLSSKGKMQALTNAVNNLSGTKILIVINERDLAGTGHSFAASISAELISLENVSFREMAFFLQRNFSLATTESEVIALRLNNAFKKFGLSSHPGFFAGIPRVTLAAFLQANRRAELLQLAVDGFLSFVVAGDMLEQREEELVLSRTTRAKFLGQVIFQMHSEKKSFLDCDLVDFATKFLAQYDYDVPALKFVQNFVDYGIVAYEEGKLRIALPFIEDYLLAVELKANPDAALKYFDIDDPGFDKNTFDIYCELGPAQNLVSAFLEKGKASSVALRTEQKPNNVFLGDEIKSSLELNDEQLVRLQKALDRLVDDVTTDRDTSSSKQKSLDLADAVKERIADTSEAAAIGKPDGSQLSSRAVAFHRFMCISLLLGSGAEYLEAAPKREFVRVVVELGEVLIEQGTRQMLKIDFEAIRKDLLSPEFIAKFSDEQESGEVEKMINGFFDLFRRVAISLPFYFVTGTMCDNSSQRVLAASILSQINEKNDEIFSLVLKSIWLAEADSERGVPILAKAVRKLPRAEMLRAYLVAHILTRVHWTHWKKPSRLAMLDVADEVLKPLNKTTAGKGELIREVQASEQKNFPGEEKATD